jgi:hypothetical protein
MAANEREIRLSSFAAKNPHKTRIFAYAANVGIGISDIGSILPQSHDGLKRPLTVGDTDAGISHVRLGVPIPRLSFPAAAREFSVKSRAHRPDKPASLSQPVAYRPISRVQT